MAAAGEGRERRGRDGWSREGREGWGGRGREGGVIKGGEGGGPKVSQSSVVGKAAMEIMMKC